MPRPCARYNCAALLYYNIIYTGREWFGRCRWGNSLACLSNAFLVHAPNHLGVNQGLLQPAQNGRDSNLRLCGHDGRLLPDMDTLSVSVCVLAHKHSGIVYLDFTSAHGGRTP
jgi:hypothetical protein